jgi:polynucleotide 5'-hydroxyl-kinase GRC3/NOL9
VIVDTTGLVSGGVARALKGAKIRLVDPDVIIALQAGEEVEHLLTPYRQRTRPKVLRLRPSHRVSPRTRAERTAHRQRRFSAYFSGGQVRALDAEQVPMENTSWTTGEPLPGHLRAHAESLLGQQVLHAERGTEGLLLITSGPPGRAGLQEVEDTFGPVRAAEATVFRSLLVGLLGAHGETLALAIMERVEFATGRMELYTPLAELGAVRAVRLGFLQLARDGTQLAWLDPADVG